MLGVDEEAVAQRKATELLARRPGDLIGRADRVVAVAEEAIGELLGLRESPVVINGVEGSAEHDGLESGETLGAVTQALSLDRSTRGRSFGVPPEQHPRASEVREADRVSVVVR